MQELTQKRSKKQRKQQYMSNNFSESDTYSEKSTISQPEVVVMSKAEFQKKYLDKKKMNPQSVTEDAILSSISSSMSNSFVIDEEMLDNANTMKLTNLN